LLKNPIGNTNIFNNSGITTFKNVRENASYENKTIVFLTPEDEELQMGSIIQLERDADSELQAYYNGSYYEMADEDIVWYFSNSTIAAANANNKVYKFYYAYKYDPDENKNQLTKPKNDPLFYAQVYMRESYDDPEYWYIGLSQEETGVNLAEPKICYYIQNLKYAFDNDYFNTSFLGFISGYDVADDPDAVDGWSFHVPKSMLKPVYYKDEENARIRNKKGGSRIPKITKNTKKDTLTKRLNLIPQVEQDNPKPVEIEKVPFTKQQKVRSKQIKMQVKYPEDEYDQFSASELFN
jgi:hypothetical protein